MSLEKGVKDSSTLMEKIEGVIGGCSSNIRNAILPILFASVISLPNAKANEVEQTEKLTEDPTATIVTANETKINELVRTDLEVEFYGFKDKVEIPKDAVSAINFYDGAVFEVWIRGRVLNMKLTERGNPPGDAIAVITKQEVNGYHLAISEDLGKLVVYWIPKGMAMELLNDNK